jgi:hypothetical protein
LLAERVVDPGDPVVTEGALVLVQDAVGHLLGQPRAENLELALLAGALVPAAEQEARVVDVMVEMVVGKEEVVDLGGAEASLDQFVGGGRAAVEHQVLATHFDDVG